ncbi:CBO0543 family protein [Virgibacillus halophilus]|uniref:CBO0543 family protein n=1 Tax=Tigheibacillus halophilus TaxID=361280 RepID=UPI003643B3E5
MIQITKTVDIQDVMKSQRSLYETNYAYWMEHVLFSFNWWFLIIISIVPWFIWWKLVDKKRLVEISSVGLLSMVIVLTLDLIGSSFVLWTYGFNVVQMILPQITIDLTLLPIINMFLYQFIPRWKPYIVATIFVALFGTFLVEPLFVWMGIYILHSWKYVYSLPIYIAFSIGLKWVLQKTKTCQNNARQ